jgi:HEAT repeat protein
MLKDRDPYIRAITVINLTIYYGQQGVERATELLDDENPHVRKSLVDTLLVVKPKGCLSLIKKMLDDPDAEVKKAATAAYEKCVSGGLE